MTTEKINISNFQTLLNKMSVHYATQLEVVLDAVTYNEIKHIPGYQISDKFIWESVMFVKENIVPILNSELNKDWDKIYDFLFKKVGEDVIAEQERILNIENKKEDLRKSKGMFAIWDMPTPPDMNWNTPYPQNVDLVVYTEDSGFGHTNSHIVQTQPTYLEIWQICDELLKKSKDTQNVKLKALQPSTQFSTSGKQNILTPIFSS